MSIHHSQLKKAERMGVALIEGDGHVTAHWPKRNWRIRGANAGHALTNMQNLQKIDEANADTFIHKIDETGTRVIIGVNAKVDGQPHTEWLVHDDFLSPIEALAQVVNWMDGGIELLPIPKPPGEAPDEPIGDPEEQEVESPDEQDGPEIEEPAEREELQAPPLDLSRMANGVPTNGATAFKEGVPNDANPFEEGSDDAQKWYEEWDAAESAKDSPETGSVVKQKYRAKYAELGHPTHCGDWLAVLLNNLVGTGEHTNLELFETICTMNGVDLSKYKRTGNGWQGRLRMTGRNILARKVWGAGGVLAVPLVCNSEGQFRAPSDWMASQRFAKNDVPAAAPAPATVATTSASTI